MKHGLSEEVSERNKVVYVHKARQPFSANNLIFEKDQIVYIGSGSKTRINSKSHRTKLHLKFWDNLYFEVVRDNLTIREALDLETSLIKENYRNGLLNARLTVSRCKDLFYDEVSEVFYLDKNGMLRWKHDRLSGCRMKIKAAEKDSLVKGSKSVKGYITCRFRGYCVQYHRLVWVLFNKKDLSHTMTIDHLDRNKSNNHPSNLEAKTQRENNLNTSIKPSSLGVKGIRYSYKQKIIHVQVCDQNGKKIHKYFCLTPLIKQGKTEKEAFDSLIQEALQLTKEWQLLYKGENIDLSLFVYPTDLDNKRQKE